MAFLTEDWANYTTIVAIGGYTSGSGVLNVGSTTSAPQNNFSRVYISDATSGTVKVILKITAINSSTQFAVTAEGTDANANAGDNVISCLTTGAENQLIADSGRIFSGSLPGSHDRKKGNRISPSDDAVTWLSDGTNWNSFGPAYPMTAPVSGNFSWTNQGTATATVRNGSIFLNAPATSGDNIRLYEMAVPGSTPYSVVVGVQPLVFMNFHGAGLYVRDNGGTSKIITLGAGQTSGSFNLILNKWNSVTSFNGTIFPSTSYAGTWANGLWWLKVRNDGTNLVWYAGVNPFDLIEVATGSITGFLANASFWGLWVDANQASIDNNHPLGAGLTLLSWTQGS